MPLQVACGRATEAGRRETNEDRATYTMPASDVARVKGVMAVLADGMGGGMHGGEAAEAVVRGLVQDYYATPDTWEVVHALGRVVAALNRWLYGQSVSRRLPGGYASTLTALVFRGQRYWLAHVGDSRAYLLRDGRLQPLTTDHVWPHAGMEHVLRRGMGLDTLVVPDFSDGRLQVGDLFLLLSDGVWGPLPPVELHRLALLHSDPASLARALIGEALRRGGEDNATALVVRVDAIPEESLADEQGEADGLPLPPRLAAGARLDDFEVEELLHDSRETLLYLGRQVASGRRYVLKTLQPLLGGDRPAKARLLAEEWLGKRLHSSYFPSVLPLQQRNYLYFAQEWRRGRTLAAALTSGEHFAPAAAVALGISLAKALGQLHRLDVLHRDIKPDNLHLDGDGHLWILDLGVAACPVMAEDGEGDCGTPGTPSFMAPELLAGGTANRSTDLYAAGVTLYHLLTRKYPYGEVEPFQHPRFGDPVPASRYRPDLPSWLDHLLLKLVARDPGDRFETAEELLLAFERGDSAGLAAVRRTPLVGRDPVLLWQAIATVSVVANLLLLFLLTAG